MATRNCENCKHPLEDGAEFCGNCGTFNPVSTGPTSVPSAPKQKRPTNYDTQPDGVPKPNLYSPSAPHGSLLQAPPPPVKPNPVPPQQIGPTKSGSQPYSATQPNLHPSNSSAPFLPKRPQSLILLLMGLHNRIKVHQSE